MPPRGRRGKDASSSHDSTSTDPKNRKTGKKPTEDSTSQTALPPRSRSRAFLLANWSYPEDPEAPLRAPRKSKKTAEPKQPEVVPEDTARTSPDSPSRNTFTPSTERYEGTEHDFTDEGFSETTGSLSQDTDPEQIFNHKWGYLPPFDEETIAIIDAIVANPEMVKSLDSRISPGKENFEPGLEHRNVLLKESLDTDPQLDLIKFQELGELAESDEEKTSHSRLWEGDRLKCDEPSNESLFQRTLMMNLIARHHLIYREHSNTSFRLDFSVERAWNCSPMPSRCFLRGALALTQPKPDLAVCFAGETLLPEDLWLNMPAATKRLACYEGIDKKSRVFHFLTIEAKKALISTSDPTARNQSLNNASQALHNMFEFFKDAGREHEETFFEKVRFFSAVASTEGILIRIHRAVRVPKNMPKLQITKDYPLRFEYRTFCNVSKADFHRKVVVEAFEKILIGYAGKLHELLGEAAQALVARLSKDDMNRRECNQDFYLYEYDGMDPSGEQTPAESRDQSVTPNNQASATQESASAQQTQSFGSVGVSKLQVKESSQGGSHNPHTGSNNSKKRGPENSEPEENSIRRKLKGVNTS